jgi:hypothetical protein
MRVPGGTIGIVAVVMIEQIGTGMTVETVVIETVILHEGMIVGTIIRTLEIYMIAEIETRAIEIVQDILEIVVGRLS